MKDPFKKQRIRSIRKTCTMIHTPMVHYHRQTSIFPECEVCGTPVEPEDLHFCYVCDAVVCKYCRDECHAKA